MSAAPSQEELPPPSAPTGQQAGFAGVTVSAEEERPSCSAAGALQPAAPSLGSTADVPGDHGLAALQSPAAGGSDEQGCAPAADPTAPPGCLQLPTASELLAAMVAKDHAAELAQLEVSTPTDGNALVDLLLRGAQNLPLESAWSGVEPMGSELQAAPSVHGSADHPEPSTPPRSALLPATSTPAASAPAPRAPADPPCWTLATEGTETPASPAALLSAAAGSAQGACAAAEVEAECVVCWEASRQVVLIPCGHVALCRRCADHLMATPEPLCPVCRRGVSFAQAFFVA
jgi:hypothetical protein